MKAGRWVQAQINNILALFIECNDAHTRTHGNTYTIQQTFRLLKPTKPQRAFSETQKWWWSQDMNQTPNWICEAISNSSATESEDSGLKCPFRISFYTLTQSGNKEYYYRHIYNHVSQVVNVNIQMGLFLYKFQIGSVVAEKCKNVFCIIRLGQLHPKRDVNQNHKPNQRVPSKWLTDQMRKQSNDQ